ncbi:2Fe-2S iron-sulfur cluster-binding protein [Nocardioides sp. NBC_00368]|uniref:2Fe-2S iron-sulfur cluster-binding protein n=1 Tax=Nocardioides sp. NBC_00368 TaxID=2976000 RepID=UPI002E1FB38E
MPTITYRQPDGSTLSVAVSDGTSVMRAALENDIRGIIGECGGQAMCATCHVYVGSTPELPPIAEEEQEMLECTAAPRDPARSRLGCQLKAGSDFEAIEVEIPARQV